MRIIHKRLGESLRGTPKYRFELILPLVDNDGHPIDQAELRQVRDRLRTRFGGYRYQPSAPFHGTWHHEGILYEDVGLMFIMDGPQDEENLRWFQEYKEELKRNFRQIEIYLTATGILWL